MSQDTCGSTDTTTGEPCSNGPNCPYHAGPGRPTQYRPRYCEKVVELGRKGASRAVMARELGVSFQTLRNWEDKYESFLEATTRARELALAWWEELGRRGATGDEHFNASAYRLQVQNRFPTDWRDRRSVEHSGEVDTGGDTHIYLPDNDRSDLPEQLAARDRALSENGADG